jgi:AraC-like DNA-binding protein
MQNSKNDSALAAERLRHGEGDPEASTGTVWPELLSSFGAVVRAFGGQAETCLQGFAITCGGETAAASAITSHKFAELLEKTAIQLGCSDLGLRLAERLTISANDQVVHRSAGCTGTRSVFDRPVTWLTRQFPNVRMRIESQPSRRLELVKIDAIQHRPAAFPQMTEFLMFMVNTKLLSLNARQHAERRIWFAHQRVGNAVSYARRFQIVPEFGRQSNSLFFRVERPGAGAGKDVRPPFPCTAVPTPAFDDHVRAAIKHKLADSECDRKQVATFLHLNTRTLQRRLRRVGLSFECLRDEVRRDLALNYLAESSMPVTEISGRLGYSEPAVLSRSCRRWFAATPSQLRRLSTCK